MFKFFLDLGIGAAAGATVMYLYEESKLEELSRAHAASVAYDGDDDETDEEAVTAEAAEEADSTEVGADGAEPVGVGI